MPSGYSSAVQSHIYCIGLQLSASHNLGSIISDIKLSYPTEQTTKLKNNSTMTCASS